MGNFAADSIMVVVETLVGYSSWNCMDCWSTPSGHHLHSGACDVISIREELKSSSKKIQGCKGSTHASPTEGRLGHIHSDMFI
jgi:hypothetical protein